MTPQGKCFPALGVLQIEGENLRTRVFNVIFGNIPKRTPKICTFSWSWCNIGPRCCKLFDSTLEGKIVRVHEFSPSARETFERIEQLGEKYRLLTKN